MKAGALLIFSILLSINSIDAFATETNCIREAPVAFASGRQVGEILAGLWRFGTSNAGGRSDGVDDTIAANLDYLMNSLNQLRLKVDQNRAATPAWERCAAEGIGLVSTISLASGQTPHFVTPHELHGYYFADLQVRKLRDAPQTPSFAAFWLEYVKDSIGKHDAAFQFDANPNRIWPQLDRFMYLTGYAGNQSITFEDFFRKSTADQARWLENAKASLAAPLTGPRSTNNANTAPLMPSIPLITTPAVLNTPLAPPQVHRANLGSPALPRFLESSEQTIVLESPILVGTPATTDAGADDKTTLVADDGTPVEDENATLAQPAPETINPVVGRGSRIWHAFRALCDAVLKNE